MCHRTDTLCALWLCHVHRDWNNGGAVWFLLSWHGRSELNAQPPDSKSGVSTSWTTAAVRGPGSRTQAFGITARHSSASYPHLKATVGFEPTVGDFAGRCLISWLRRLESPYHTVPTKAYAWVRTPTTTLWAIPVLTTPCPVRTALPASIAWHSTSFSHGVNLET